MSTTPLSNYEMPNEDPRGIPAQRGDYGFEALEVLLVRVSLAGWRHRNLLHRADRASCSLGYPAVALGAVYRLS